MYFCNILLILLTVQCSLNSFLFKKASQCNFKGSAPLSIFSIEIGKLIGATCLTYMTDKHSRYSINLFTIVATCKKEIYLLVVPSVLYAVQGHLMQVAIRNMHSGAFQLACQFKIVVVAGLSALMLGRRLDMRQVLAIVMLTIGLVALQAEESLQKLFLNRSKARNMSEDETKEGAKIFIKNKKQNACQTLTNGIVNESEKNPRINGNSVVMDALSKEGSEYVAESSIYKEEQVTKTESMQDCKGATVYECKASEQMKKSSDLKETARELNVHNSSQWKGFVCVIAGCILNGLANVLFERLAKVFQQKGISMWQRCQIYGLISSTTSFVMVLFKYFSRESTRTDDQNEKKSKCSTQSSLTIPTNFHWWMLSVVNQMLGGLLVGIVVENNSSTGKLVATSASLLLTNLFSKGLFKSYISAGGVFLVLLGTVLYYK